MASERSERVTYRGNTIENRGCLFIYLYIIWTYLCHFVLWPSRFCVSYVVDPVPNCTKQNPLVYRISTCITLEIELFTFLNSFAGAVKTWKLKGLPFLFELVAVVSQCLFAMVISRAQQHLLENTLSTRLLRR